ncbi:hypothetical protein ACJX0J_021259, partial [Zea mays]
VPRGVRIFFWMYEIAIVICCILFDVRQIILMNAIAYLPENMLLVEIVTLCNIIVTNICFKGIGKICHNNKKFGRKKKQIKMSNNNLHPQHVGQDIQES